MNSLTIHYDNGCNFCISIKNIVARLDTNNQIAFVALKESDDVLWAKDNNGNIYKFEEILPPLAKLLPGINRFSWMFEGAAGKKTSKLFYQGLEKIKDLHNKVRPCRNCR